jgi:predicted lactoylglutathione lyase
VIFGIYNTGTCANSASVQILQTAFSLPVADPQRSHKFYRRVFGADICSLEENTVAVQMPGMTVFFVEREEFNLLLKPAESEADFVTGKFTSMLSCTVLTRDELYSSLKSAVEGGGTPCSQAVPYPWGMAAYFKDPDSHLWEILWRDSKFQT